MQNEKKVRPVIKRRYKKISLDKFIDGANEDENSKVARKRVSVEHILLSATGKVENRETYSKVLLYILPELEDDMAKYCSGTKQAILTYLVKRGLQELINDNKVVIYEIN